MSIYLKTKKLEKQENSLVSSETTATPSSSIPTTLEPIAPRYEQKNTPEVPEDFPPPSDFFSLHQKTLVFIQNKNIIIAIAVVLVLVSGGYTWFNLRANNFLKEGKAALVEKNYSVALESLTQYAEFANPSEEEIILLARAQLMSGNIMQAEKTLRPLSQKFSELPKASYINAAANYGNAPQKAMSLLEKSKYSSYPPVYALLGIFALLENNPVIARDYLEKTVDTLSNTELSVEETQTLNDLLLHSYYFYLQNTDVKIGEKFPLPFDKLKKPMPIDKNLGFAVNTEGFNNYYGIPLNVEALAQQENSTPASDIVALQALSYVIDKNHKQARKIIVESTVASQSLLSQYIIAYLDMADGDTQSAQKHYEEINQRTPSTYSFAYAAGAAWSRQEGNLPNDDILAMYQKATDTDPTNTVALNNYVFLLMYAGNEKKAAELIKQAQKRNLLNNELLALSFLLDISAQRQPETTRVELLDELSNNPESSLLLNAAIVLEKLSGNYAEAATLTRRLQILLPEEPRVVDTLADLYELRQQQLLMIDTLEQGYRKFPFDEAILNRLLLTYAKNGSRQKTYKLLQVSSFQLKDESIGLHAKALLDVRNTPSSTSGMEQAKLAIEKAPTAQRKAEIANDFAHIYLDYNFIERTSYFYPFIAEAAKTGSVVDDIALRALDARLKSASAADNINAEEIRVILQEAEKHHHVIAQVDACLALAAVGDSKHAINHLKNMRKKQNASTSILRALLNVYKQSNDANNAERIEARIAVLEQRLPRDTAEKLSKKNQSAEAIFVNYTDESEFIKSIDQAVEERDFNKAIDLYTQLLSHETIRTKNPARTYQNRAGFYMAIENYVRAAEDYAKALEIGKLNLSSENIVRHNYARALFSIKDYRGVVEQLELLLPAKAPEDLNYLRLLAFSQHRLSNMDASIDAYLKIIEKYPEQIESYLRIAAIEVQRNRAIEAVSILNQALEIEPRNVSVHKMLSGIYISVEEPEKAQRHLNIAKQEGSQ